MKRKGDVTISTVILIILGLAVLVMLIVGFTQGFDFLFGLFDRGPSELQTLASACVLYAKGGLQIDFCTYREAGDELVRCDDSRFNVTFANEGVTTKPTCSVAGSSEDDNLRSALCLNKKDTVKFGDGKTCKDYRNTP